MAESCPITRFAWVIDYLCKLIASHGRFSLGFVLGNRLRRAAGRFAALHRRLQADPSQARATAPVRAPRAAPKTPTPGIPTSSTLPRGFAWLRRPTMPHMQSGTGLLIAFVNDPAIVATLRADYRYARMLRPLCHMLGLAAHHRPDFLRPLPRQRQKRPKPAGAESRAPDTEPGHPIAARFIPPRRMRARLGVSLGVPSARRRQPRAPPVPA